MPGQWRKPYELPSQPLAALTTLSAAPPPQMSWQGQIYRDNSGAERGLLMRGLHQLCVGSKGKLVPLSVLPMEGAIPQIVSLPRAADEDTASGGYYVAYTTVPQARQARASARNGVGREGERV